ncbi:DegT/DnrJ/EryC1/StrS family aminotransferase [Paenibacillus sp.]|jgi:dTDP-4-amino-4,6-dideoxygalactose transaminase|uniref:DegT/DnrJ/EryC1/StrS family aminotransferase n=1 Tax=Paenibacillus sp. TaxID=58172 RepID=UPI002831C8F5|nr:DegT/DnrJ/EryC1/StrS family aminotransferase [Paenibacillus sp.]MDR0267484.1 DegT/DnrJ/EryC1/StrS family aminotransferase [Paenibacillus sp.]
MDWKVTLYDLDVGEEEISAVTKVLENRWISMGAEVTAFEQEFARMLGHNLPGAAVNSGTSALHAAMHALSISPGDEVLVPSMTFVAGAASVRMVGATPVFVDSKSLDDFNIDPVDIRRKITPKTKAVLIVHYGGYPADMTEIMEIANEHGIKVIEDVAHGPFINTPLGMAGTVGDIGCFSFFSTKNITTAEGGMLVSKDEAVLEKARLFRSHYMGVSSWSKHQGRISSYDVVGVGMNYRMTELSGALGRVQLRKFAANQEKREQVARWYRDQLLGFESLQIAFVDRDLTSSTHHIFPVILASEIDRNTVMEKLKQAGIQTSVHYPACHLFRYYREQLGNRLGECPIAEQISGRELSLPMHAAVTQEQVTYVCDQLRVALKEKGQ